MNGPILVTAAIIENSSGEILIAQRPVEQEIAGGLWEFPGGKVEPGEDPEACVVREIREELGFDIRVTREFGLFSHVYRMGTGDRLLRQPLHIVLAAYWAEVDATEFKLDGVAAVKWVSRSVRPVEVFAPADVEIVARVWPVVRSSF